MSRKIIFMLSSPVWGKWKEISNILFRKHDHERVVEWFLNSKKVNKVWKSWDLSRSHDIIHVGCGKKIEKVFAQSVMYDVYKPKYLRKRIIALRKIRYDLESKWRSNWGLTSKLFCRGNREHRLFHEKI